jgi:hypothetical protein
MKNKIVIGYSTNLPKDFQKEFNKELLASVGLSQEKSEVAIIAYDNDGFLSLSEAYNDIWECAETFKDAIFVFIHHDIHFKSNGWGRALLDLFNNNEVDIIGVAGTEKLYQHGSWPFDENFQADIKSKNLWGKMWQLNEQDEPYLSDFTGPAKKCKTLQPVVVVDGIFIAFNPETCLKFDEDFDDFHFYDISFCVKNHTQGKRVAVTETIEIFHESMGYTDEVWNQNRLKFCEKYLPYLPLSI